MKINEIYVMEDGNMLFTEKFCKENCMVAREIIHAVERVVDEYKDRYMDVLKYTGLDHNEVDCSLCGRCSIDIKSL